MTNLFSLWAVPFVLLAALPTHAQPSGEAKLFAAVEQAIKAQDATTLASYFNRTVEVIIDAKDQTYPKNQAQFVIKEFFGNYPVRSFSFIHKGNSGETFYGIGSYISTRGGFDTNIFVKKYAEGYRIDQIRFEKDGN